ncbi:hypothetical protein T265_03288 [Opisthorchis viverrini]|uniref:Uncharacterized protein n=1 Tax=Opisthorchis viverrini TaxID=6198 RepID=A0A074ZT05_OPIVI|nr:hypothetical protein T265_03288 [Opisthorchis viverrini]KER30231.1 hypothetical protein T265_03288 [Opisthorchis viverrini]
MANPSFTRPDAGHTSQLEQRQIIGVHNARSFYAADFLSCQGLSQLVPARWLKWLEREFVDRKALGSNPTSASRLPLSRFGQPGSILTLVLPSDGMAARHRKGVRAEQ